MEHRTAFITGASDGIGAELARRLAAKGVEVGISARREEKLHALADEIRAAGGKARVYPLDVGDPERVTEVIQGADDDMEGLDLVIANAGIGKGRWGGKLTWEHCEPVIRINVIGAVATLTAVLPRMAERKRGHLVGMSSIAAFRGMARVAAYSGSKAFLSNFLGSLRIDLRSTGVTVTELRPGYIRTAMLQDFEKLPPFTMELERACDTMMRAIEGRRTVVTFPLPVAMAMRSVNMIPDSLYAWLRGG
jgi:short-subunit dehydrogenase